MKRFKALLLKTYVPIPQLIIIHYIRWNFSFWPIFSSLLVEYAYLKLVWLYMIDPERLPVEVFSSFWPSRLSFVLPSDYELNGYRTEIKSLNAAISSHIFWETYLKTIIMQGALKTSQLGNECSLLHVFNFLGHKQSNFNLGEELRPGFTDSWQFHKSFIVVLSNRYNNE